jgi:hypothetical protein
MRISVDTAALTAAAARLQSMRRAGERRAEEAGQVARRLVLEIKAREQFDQLIGALSRELRRQASAVGAQGRFLSLFAAARYEKAEEQLLAAVADVRFAWTSDDMTKADAEVQRQLKELLGRDEYSREAWRLASRDEREAILQRLSEDIARIMGIPAAEIMFHKGLFSDTRGFCYQTSAGGNVISIHQDLLTEGRLERVADFHFTGDHSYEESLAVLFHEYRHAYQHQVQGDPLDLRVDDATRDAWISNSGDGYKTQARDGYKAYRDQPVEVDARQFSAGVIPVQDYETFGFGF